MFKGPSRPAQVFGLGCLLVSSHYCLHTEDARVWDVGLMSILKGICPNGVVWRSSQAQGTGGLPFARKKPLETCWEPWLKGPHWHQWELLTGGHNTHPQMAFLQWWCLACLLMLTFLHVLPIGPFSVPLVLGGIHAPGSCPISPPNQKGAEHDHLHFPSQPVVVT